MDEESADSLITPEKIELDRSNIGRNSAENLEQESTDSMITPENFELDRSNIGGNSAENSDALINGSSGDARQLRTSTDAHNAEDSSTMNSTEKLDLANSSKKKVVPHYLRASTGSCHDFCKYGRKHPSEEKETKHWLKRTTKSLSNEQYHNAPILVSGEQKKEKVVNHKPSTDSKNHPPVLKPSPDTKSPSSKTNISLDKGKVVKHKPSTDNENPSQRYTPKSKTSSDMKKVVKHKPSTDNENPTQPDTPKAKTSSDKKKVVKCKPSTDAPNHSPDLRPSPDTTSYSPKPRTSLDKEKVVKHSPDTRSYLRKAKMSSGAKTDSPSQNASSSYKAHLPKHEPSPSKKFASPDPPEIVKSVVYVEDPVEQGFLTDDKMSIAEEKAAHLSMQRTSPVNSRIVKVKPPSSSDTLDGMRGKLTRRIVKVKPPSSSDTLNGMRGNAGRNSDCKTGQKMTAWSKASSKKVSAPPTTGLSPKLPIKITSIKSRQAGNLKLVSPSKDRNRIPHRVRTKISSNENVSEKTLHVIETKTENNESISDDHAMLPLPSPSSAKSLSQARSSSLASVEEDGQETTELTDGEADEFTPGNESLEIDEAPPVKENLSKTLRKGRGVVSQDKSSSPVKLRFRTGKVVDVQTDNNSPRRLRFRRARACGTEDNKGNLRRRAFKKAGFNDGVAERSSESVVLKHQDVQNKKDAQGLLNIVIEETASKLAESRKSKVKALVGAFESVISLKGSKSSSQAAAG